MDSYQLDVCTKMTTIGASRRILYHYLCYFSPFFVLFIISLLFSTTGILYTLKSRENIKNNNILHMYNGWLLVKFVNGDVNCGRELMKQN